MNIYFSCSITGGRTDQTAYQAIVAALQADGHAVPTAILADDSVLIEEAQVSADEVYKRDIAWLDGCDVVVAEVSTPSHGVGYEIAYALGIGKPVLCGYKDGVKVSKMLTGNSMPGIRVAAYTGVEDFIHTVREFLADQDKGRQTGYL